jgi:tetratricopeptide (TPR) repeat protein
MKRSFFITGLFLLALASFGCGGASSDANNANTPAESPFAHITDANEALAEGNRLFDENQIDMAIAAYQRAVEIDPDLADAHFQLGIAWSLVEMRANQTGETIEQADKKKPNSDKEFEKAIEAYKKWLDANPKDDVAYFNLGRAYTKLLKDNQAEDSFRQAVKLKPDDTEYQTELGAVLIKLAKYYEAIGPLKKALELDPTNSRAEAMLEDAQAGRQRIDFVGPKNTNTNANAAANTAANTNANMAANSNTNSAPPKTPAANVKATPKPTPGN